MSSLFTLKQSNHPEAGEKYQSLLRCSVVPYQIWME